MLSFPIFKLLQLIYLLLCIGDIITLPCKPKEKLFYWNVTEKLEIKVVVFTAISIEWGIGDSPDGDYLLLFCWGFIFYMRLYKHVNL